MAATWRGGSPNNAIGALSQLLGYVVALINDEILVEDLEDLTALEIGHVDAETLRVS